MAQEDREITLDKHFKLVEKIVLSRQDIVTGLLPASTAITTHGDYTDAWVRDNVYSILSVWGLALAYKRENPHHYRTHTLSMSVVKLMRGILSAMMRQADRVEAYKKSHNPLDALHAKYGTDTGLAVVGDDEWGHLQLDATSLFVLMIAQMSASGLSIIYTVDEVNFVQNLVHYISHTYLTPDYGIWERGDKINHGNAEINCSSVGMAKAALEAISGFNLFHDCATQEGVIHVVPNDIARSRLTLKGLLPRESDSKETDAALLSIIGYPAYAVEDVALIEKTRTKIIERLAGNYGCKRFLLDGHQSSIEDASRLHYEPSELREFEHIESEWPLFFTYLLLDAIMREDRDSIVMWREKLEPLFVEEEGVRLLPELYIVPQESVAAEKAAPHSQERVANENIPLVWAQSLYMLSEMILEGVLDKGDIDPLCRVRRVGASLESTPLVAIVAQNESVKNYLAECGVASQSIDEIEPTSMHARELSKVHGVLGANRRLGLTGRELLIPRTVTSSRIHLLSGKKILFFPYYFDPREFYFGFDNNLVVEHFKSSLRFLATSWAEEKAPIIPFLVREDMLKEHSKDVIIGLLWELQTGKSDELDIHSAPLEALLEYADTISIDGVDIAALQDIRCEDTQIDMQEYFLYALEHDWRQVRLISQKLNKYDVRLEDALMDILIAQKRLAVGRAYSDETTISTPQETQEIIKKIDAYCGNNESERVLTQEVILHLGHLIRVEPELFKDMLTLRTWDSIQLLVGHISRERGLNFGDAYSELLRFSPHGIYTTLRFIFHSYTEENQELKELENLHICGVKNLQAPTIKPLDGETIVPKDWEIWREKVGMIAALKSDFYEDVWHILQRCSGLVIGDKYSTQSRIGAELTLEATAGERNFELKVETLLQGIAIASYRELNIELIEALIKVFQANPELKVESDLILDIIIGYAVKIAWSAQESAKDYDECKGEAWSAFYKLSVFEAQENFIAAFFFLTQEREV